MTERKSRTDTGDGDRSCRCMQNQEHCGTGYETDCNSRSRTYLLSDVHTYTIQDRIYVRYVCMIHVYRSTTHRMAGRRHPSPFQIAQKPPNIAVDIWRFLGDLRKAMALSVAGRPNRLEYRLKNLLTERASFNRSFTHSNQITNYSTEVLNIQTGVIKYSLKSSAIFVTNRECFCDIE